jgi:propionate CoA-transferase
MDFRPKISKNLKIMNERIFNEEPVGIKIGKSSKEFPGELSNV